MGLLSGGQRQSITLLMATMLRPELLLLDEHTAALDPKTAENVLQLTDKLVAEHNLTTLMITHNMRDALRFGNRLIMMDSGRIIYDVKGEEKKQINSCRLTSKVRSSWGKCIERPYGTRCEIIEEGISPLLNFPLQDRADTVY